MAENLNLMVAVRIKNSNTVIYCDSAEMIAYVYGRFANDFTLIINGEELKRIGYYEGVGYFAGYTTSYFEKYFK